jgi:hypothetical protein
MAINGYGGVKVFSATKHQERATLGDQIGDWLKRSGAIVIDTVVSLSSDSEFHCLAITVFYK